MPFTCIITAVTGLTQLSRKDRRLKPYPGVWRFYDVIRVTWHPGLIRIEPGEYGRSGRRAERACCHHIIKRNSLFRDSVHIRRPAGGLTPETQSVSSLVISNKEET